MINNPEAMFIGMTQPIKEKRKKVLLNSHLTKLQNEIYLAIKYADHHKLCDLGAKAEIDMNFMIEVEKDHFYHPIIVAAIQGDKECL